ncbi:MAG: hypothetical protein M3388_10510 [Acidobacteriota bacterium]|nr:hypothetical protein [Acidobacteriota bacterium]
MKTLEEKKKDRFQFLQKMYEKKNRGGLQIFHTSKISEELSLQESEADLIVEYLEGEGLTKIHSDGGELISITHSGILEVEQAISEPNKPTEHFPPIINFISIEQMNNSQIQQGSTNSNQTFNLTKHNLDSLKKFIELFEERFLELQFNSDDDKNEAIAEIQTIKTQLTSPRPKDLAIQESRKTLRNILEGMTGSVLATELLKYLLGAN